MTVEIPSAPPSAAPDAAHQPVRHPEILAELHKLQNRSTNWTSTILVLAVSLAAFVGLGAWSTKSWELLLAIVGILLVHEAGHYLAMVVFRYRNVRMFFIPFLGAAVTGEQYTAPGWKKVIVALMGPLPGIFLAAVIGLVGIIKGSDPLLKIALLGLVLNGLQLLPILPLDGGRVMHTILFCRNLYLDTVFVLAAALALAGIGAATNDRFVMFLGIALLIGIPASFKVAKLASELRRAGVSAEAASPAAPSSHRLAQPVPAADPAQWPALAPLIPVAAHDATAAGDVRTESIPPDVADAIITRIRTLFPLAKSNKAIARLTLMAYEVLVSRPPGVLASLCFGFVHGAAFVIALILVAVFVVAQHPNEFQRLLAAGAVDPAFELDPAFIVTWSAEQPSSIPSTNDSASTSPSRSMIVATLNSSVAAREAFAEVQRAAPASAVLVCFGQSVFLSLPVADEAAQAKWLADFESRTDEVFVSDPDAVSLTLVCQGPSIFQTLDLHNQLSAYFAMPAEVCLIPPWLTEQWEQRPVAQRAREERARALYYRLSQTAPPDLPELETLSDELYRAQRRNKRAEVTRLSARYQEVRTAALVAELERVRDELTDPGERDLADRYIALQRAWLSEPYLESDDDSSWSRHAGRLRTELGPLLGQLPGALEPSGPAPDVQQHLVCSCYSQLAGGTRLVLTLQFEDFAVGAPTFVLWLQRQGCAQFEYDLVGGCADFDED